MMSPQTQASIDKFLTVHETPSDSGARFFQLRAFLTEFHKTQNPSLAEIQTIVAYINQQITHWLPTERVAEQNWWVEIEVQEYWEYGVNGVGSAEEFKGYRRSPHWMMPLAKIAILDFEMASLMNERCVDEFIQIDAYKDLESLHLLTLVGAYCIKEMMKSRKFEHLKVLRIPNIYFGDAGLRTKFEGWMLHHNIQNR